LICWSIKNGVPFDVAHSLSEGELLGYAITFAQLDNGNKTWDWDNMKFLEK